jgi:hypothetical protein
MIFSKRRAYNGRPTIGWFWIRSKKEYDWLNSQFHCSHLESRGVPGKTREIPGKKTREIISLSFPVHDFRWRNFRWRHIRWFNFRSHLRTRALPAPPHCTTSNAVWAVLIYYSRGFFFQINSTNKQNLTFWQVCLELALGTFVDIGVFWCWMFSFLLTFISLWRVLLYCWEVKEQIWSKCQWENIPSPNWLADQK